MALRDLWVRIKGENTHLKGKLKETEKDVEGVSGKVKSMASAMMAAAAAGAAAFGVIIAWAKDTDFGLQAINQTLAVGKQLLTDFILGQKSNAKEAFINAGKQSKINNDNIKEGYLVKKMQSELAQLITASADQTKSHAEKLEILTKAMEKEKELKAFLLKDAREELQVAYDNWRMNLQSIDAKKKYYEIAGRIQDIEGMDSRRLQSQFTAELVAQKERADALVDAFTEVKEVLQEINDMPINPVGLGGLKAPTVGGITSPGLQTTGIQTSDGMQNLFGGFKAVDQWKSMWESAIMDVTGLMADSFINVFEAIGAGTTENLGKNMLGSMGRLVADLGKMLVALGTTWLTALTLIKVPTIPSAVAAIAAGAAAMAIGGAMVGASKKAAGGMETGSYSGGGSSASMQPQTIKIVGELKGKDIHFSLQRYLEDN